MVFGLVLYFEPLLILSKTIIAWYIRKPKKLGFEKSLKDLYYVLWRINFGILQKSKFDFANNQFGVI